MRCVVGQLEDDDEEEVPSCCVLLLDIYAHHARGIHNISIYADQDVYAKFALTSAPDDAPALATRVAPGGGGASPRFDERLPPLRVRRGRLAVDVLKCELWMRSCADKRLLGDQLLGFALVPLAAVAAAQGAALEGDFELSSTDLFHSPAGTVRLSLALRSGGLPGDASSEAVLLEHAATPPVDDRSRIEFTDLKVAVAQENDAMAVQYLPFLGGGASPPRGEKSAASSEGSKNAADASTASTVSEDREAVEMPRPEADHEATAAPSKSCRSPGTPTSCAEKGPEKGDVFKLPLMGDIVIDMEAEEQSAMQRQIMEMYVKGMQQFSQSLAKMKLPIELGANDGVVVQKEAKPDSSMVFEQQQAKKDGARVFYGSRAFF